MKYNPDDYRSTSNLVGCDWQASMNLRGNNDHYATVSGYLRDLKSYGSAWVGAPVDQDIAILQTKIALSNAIQSWASFLDSALDESYMKAAVLLQCLELHLYVDVYYYRICLEHLPSTHMAQRIQVLARYAIHQQEA